MRRPKEIAFRLASDLHRVIHRLSGGRVLARVAGMDVLVLETIGRRSGKRRKVMLTTPVRNDDRVVLVASYGGDDHHPAWLLNLRDEPHVRVTIDGTERPMIARAATPEEKAELWPQVVASYEGYATYQRRTDREIPVVILTDIPLA